MMDEDPEYELVSPLVIGDLDEHAFAVGTRYGEISYRIQTEKPRTLEHCVESVLVPQLDLLAMAHGYALKTAPHDDEWTMVTFLRNGFLP